MSTTKTNPTPTKTTPPGTDLDHWFCCDPDTALCGTDLTHHQETDMNASDEICLVCEDLIDNDCKDRKK